MDRDLGFKARTVSPIMLVAFNRPLALTRQLERIEVECSRVVEVFIDGPKSESDPSQLEVIRIASTWAKQTHHDVNIYVSQINFGIREHFPYIAERFFSKHNSGIILEDDIYFSSAFFDYCDNFLSLDTESKLWSICGHNPTSNILSTDSKINYTFLSNIHTIHGWATNANSVERFLEFRAKPASEILKSISSVSKKLTFDPMLRKSFELTWKRKFLRSISENGGGSWDNSWELAGWFNQAHSIMPSFSLTREDNSTNEGGTHSFTRSSTKQIMQFHLPIDYEFSSLERRRDIKMMKVWGITRKYSWAYWGRVRRQLLELENTKIK